MNTKNFSVGQSVWVLRTGGPLQKAVISSISSISCPGRDVDEVRISVEWSGEDGEVLGKTVAIGDVFPSYSDYVPPHQEPQQPNLISSGSKNTGANCHICGQTFKNLRGVRTHISKRHPVEANSSRLNATLGEPQPAKDVRKKKNSLIKSQVSEWVSKFRNMLSDISRMSLSDFDTALDDFLEFLKKSNNELPGPKHPAVRFFHMRKNGYKKNYSTGASKTSNPKRSNKAARERRQEAYQYELAQYNYYNRRKRVARAVMNNNESKTCMISLEEVEQHFGASLSVPNVKVRDEYKQSLTNPDIGCFKIESIHKAIKSISLDTSPGPDGVLARTVKHLDLSCVIKLILEIMLKSAYTPKALRTGRTILIYKGKGSRDDISSWRPITVYSIIRRIIEKVIDAELRLQVQFHKNQRGFVKGLPGCHVNSRLMDAIIKNAKVEKRDCVVAFLDVIGAFDSIGHQHVLNSLESRGVSKDIMGLIASLLTNNTTRVSVDFKESKDIGVRRGVPQGGPLSPTLFNLAIDFVYEEMCETTLANNLGYKLKEDHDGILLTGFADDQAVTTNGKQSAERAIDLIQGLLREVGLSINPKKSTAMVIEKGELTQQRITLDNGGFIETAAAGDIIKYLGCSYSGELAVNEASVRDFNDNLTKLITTNLLKPDQKLNILNQYVFPKFTYPLQTAPLTKLQPSLLSSLDVIIRTSVKAMLSIPANASNAMLYAPRRHRGLGLLRCEWEAPLQHWSIAQKLSRVQDHLFQSIFDAQQEISLCAERLGLECYGTNDSVRGIRKVLRGQCFDRWTECKWQGYGVIHFKDNPKSNTFIWDKKKLSGSEWISALKLNMNYAPLRGVPGAIHQGDVGSLCRRCGRELETPAHVLGKCPHNMLLVTRRHHRIKRELIKMLEVKFDCFEEVYGLDEDGSSRFADIIAFGNNTKTAYILDPTIRYETNDPDQADKIDAEKRQIYEKCIRFYKEKFRDRFGDRDFIVRGLWFGSRGTIPKKTMTFLEEVGISSKELLDLAELIIIDAVAIINYHIYS